MRGWLVGIIVGLMLASAYWAGRHSLPEREVRDTVVVRDTVTKYLPQPKVVEAVGSKAVVLPRVVPMMLPADSVEVEIPIERVVYEEADFRAVVEGFNPRLVEYSVYPTTQIVRVAEPPKPLEISVGPAVVAGWTHHGFDVCVGFGAVLKIKF